MSSMKAVNHGIRSVDCLRQCLNFVNASRAIEQTHPGSAGVCADSRTRLFYAASRPNEAREMRIGLGRAWDRKTASGILGVISVVDSRDHEECKPNASTAAVGESPTWVRLQRNLGRHFVWKQRQQRFFSLTSPTEPATKRPVLPTRNWRRARRLSAEDQSERNCRHAS